jgi:CheY-like chemotaxis protein
VVEGLGALDTAYERGGRVDAVILDHMMPARDGFDFAREVRADRRFDAVPLLMLTSAGPAEGAERARAEGIAGYMSKPVSRSDLLRALSAILDQVDVKGSPPEMVTRQSIGHDMPGRRILLAEDNPVNQQVAVALLRKRGHEVVAVPDGAEAVELAEGGSFDIVLMDIQMPVMDGLEATRRIRAQAINAELPIVALTAHAFAEERERCRAAGMNDFLAKPFKPDDLYDLVERWTGGGGASAKAQAESGTTRAPTPMAPPVDLEGFRAIMREAGVEEVVDATVEIYLDEAPGIYSGLDAAVIVGVPEEVRRTAHSLKSASGNIRATRFAALLQAMEDRGRDGDVDGARAAHEELRSEYRKVMEFLQRSRGG